jgi:hypothetical protein
VALVNIRVRRAAGAEHHTPRSSKQAKGVLSWDAWKAFLGSGDRFVGFDLMVAGSFLIVDRFLRLLTEIGDNPQGVRATAQSGWVGAGFLLVWTGTMSLAKFTRGYEKPKVPHY